MNLRQVAHWTIATAMMCVQSAALGQSLPKYEIHELGNANTSDSNHAKYVATVVDRAANTLWLCSISFHIRISGGLVVDTNECHVNAKGPFPNLANMKAAQVTTPGNAGVPYTFLWLADQATGDVSLCFEEVTLTYNNNNEVGCGPLTHPSP